MAKRKTPLLINCRVARRRKPMAFETKAHKYEKSPSETLVDLERAITRMGSVSKVDHEMQTVEGKIKYGLGAQTKVRAKVQQEGNESIIYFESAGGDVFGRAARDNVEHLLEAMKQADNPDFEVTKATKKQWTRVGYLALSLVLILVFTVVFIAIGKPELSWIPALLIALIFYWQRRKQKNP